METIKVEDLEKLLNEMSKELEACEDKDYRTGYEQALQNVKTSIGGITQKYVDEIKKFLYIITKSTVSRTYGGANETADIYEVVDGEIKHIGETKWCTRGYMGEVGEINRFLLNNKFITKEQSIDRYGKFDYYYNSDNGFYTIEKF